MPSYPMRRLSLLLLSPSLVAAPLLVHAQGANPEDLPIDDEPVAAAPAPQPAPPANTSTAPAVPVNPVAPPAAAGGDVVTVPRAVWEQLLRDVEELKRARNQAPATPTTPAETPVTGTTPTATTPEDSGKRNYMLLPDISLTVNSVSKLGNDKLDDERNKFNFGEGELSIQGYVYPNVKADAFLVAAPAEDEALNFEEGYLTFLGAAKNLNIIAGRKFAPFGRTGEQHPHSWLYSRQLLARRNLVAGEGLTGDGGLLRYLLPTKSVFANLDVGIWNAAGGPGSVATDPDTGEYNPDNPFGGALPGGTESGFYNRFVTARLWLAKSFGRNNEFELGGSYASGKSQFDDDEGNTLDQGRSALKGVDLSYRRFLSNNRRLLLRTEWFQNDPKRLSNVSRASGYYGLANYRLDKQNDVGLLYERSGFLQAPGQRENALSLLYTRQFSEQFYARVQGTRGKRPVSGSYNELYFQLVWGLGPHSHTLE